MNPIKSCDVLVCGGGFAGISAALAAARKGAKTVLLERQFILGGLGTAGIVTIYLPLCDGKGRQVSFGIAEELLRLSISMGWEARYPKNWLESDDPAERTEKDPRFLVQYNPQLFALLAEELLLKEGVEILYGTYAVDTVTEGDKITAVVTESKSGRQAIGCKSVVDATGDCDIAWFSKAPTATFGPGNVLAGWYYSLNGADYRLNLLGAADILDDGEVADPKKGQLTRRRFTGLDRDEISEMTCLSHRHTLNDIRKKRAEGDDRVPVTMTTIPQLRMTRRIVGEYTLDIKEEHKYFEDSVGLIGDWTKRGPVYEVPFRTLYSAKMKNLITAGRIISVTDPMWNVSRVIPCCAVTGQAAGTAAATCNDFTTLDVGALQAELMKDGVVLHEKYL